MVNLIFCHLRTSICSNMEVKILGNEEEEEEEEEADGGG